MCKHFVENSQMHETASRLFEAIQHATKGRVDGFSSPGDAAALATMFAAGAFAHGGGLNSQGCHNDYKTGGYHCH